MDLIEKYFSPGYACVVAYVCEMILWEIYNIKLCLYLTIYYNQYEKICISQRM